MSRIEAKADVFSRDEPRLLDALMREFNLQEIKRPKSLTATTYFGRLCSNFQESSLPTDQEEPSLRVRDYLNTGTLPTGVMMALMSSRTGNFQAKWPDGRKTEIDACSGESYYPHIFVNPRTASQFVRLFGCEINPVLSAEGVKLARRIHYGLTHKQENERITHDLMRDYFVVENRALIHRGNLGPRFEIKTNDPGNQARFQEIVNPKGASHIRYESLRLLHDWLLRQKVEFPHVEFMEIESKIDLKPSTTVDQFLFQLPTLISQLANFGLKPVLPLPYCINRARRYHVMTLSEDLSRTIVESRSGNLGAKIKKTTIFGVENVAIRKACANFELDRMPINQAELALEIQSSHTAFEKHQVKIHFSDLQGQVYLISFDYCISLHQPSTTFVQVEVQYAGRKLPVRSDEPSLTDVIAKCNWIRSILIDIFPENWQAQPSHLSKNDFFLAN